MYFGVFDWNEVVVQAQRNAARTRAEDLFKIYMSFSNKTNGTANTSIDQRTKVMAPNDDVDKISLSYPAVNQVEDQVEGLQLAHCRLSSHAIAYLKVVFGAWYSAR